MAIVKFVSDKNCQVFIDMELAGKVTADSMLKITLETGGYLIHIKDEEGNLIKEYDLEINSSDNQLLQKIDDANNLDDIIEKLKNDSTLVFHCDRASFCHNGMYGFVNKKLNVVIPPIYYSVNEFVDDKAFVVRDFPEGRRTTMIDSDGNMFFNRWFDYIGESNETILFGINDRIIVYSKTKHNKISEYYNAGYDHKASLVPVYKKVGHNNFYGYIDFDGKEIIPFIFNNVGNFNEKEMANVLFLGKQVKIDKLGYHRHLNYYDYDWAKWDDKLFGLEGILEEDQDPHPWCYSTGENDWYFIPEWNNFKWIIRISINEVGPQNGIKNFDFNCDYIIKLGRGYIICKQGDKILVLVANIHNDSVDKFYFDADDVVPVFEINENLQGDDIITSRTFIVKKNNKYGVYNILGEVTIPIEYDEIIPFGPYEFAVRKAKKYGVLKDFKLTALIYDNVTEHINSNNVYNGLLLEKSGRYGLLKTWSTIPPIYDCIDSHGDRNIVSLNGKYGIVDDDNKEVLPIKYDMIVPLGDYYFKVKTEKGWSLGYIQHGIIYRTSFDDIYRISEKNKRINSVFLVKEGNQYGCINNHGEIIIPIEYSSIYFDSDYYPVTVSFLIFKDNKVGFGVYYSSYLLKRNREYIYYVEPQFDECVLLENSNSVLNAFDMPYAAVRNGKKWGILDQMPRDITYKAIELNLEEINKPNWDDLDFKYNSLDELKKDADKELKRRYDKNYHPWTIRRDMNGKDCIVEE